jgi:UDP-glucose 4-epimerase
VRDYIHVTDLAVAHVKAMQKLDDDPLMQLNLGTGAGFSNLELVDAVSRSAGVELKPEMGPRRPGDPPELVADPGAALRLLDWRPSRSDINDIVTRSYWVSVHPDATHFEDESGGGNFQSTYK